MSLRELIKEEVVVSEVTVEYKGKKYVVKGSPDANLITSTLMLREDQAETKARHYSRLGCGEEFSLQLVRHILVVTATLQPDPGEPPYDESEIAILSKKQGPLFLKILTGGLETLGLTGDTTGAFDKVAAGNSEKEEGSNSSSTSG